MQGSQKVIDHLQKQLTLELSSMDQYLAHSKMYEDWGLFRLHAQLAHEYEEEVGHAHRIMERMLLLEGTPDTATRAPIQIGKDVHEMLSNDLSSELEVAGHLRKVVSVCEEERDYVSRDILLKLLNDTEMDHIYWLEQHLGMIDRIGLPNYIQSQMKAATIE